MCFHFLEPPVCPFEAFKVQVAPRIFCKASQTLTLLNTFGGWCFGFPAGTISTFSP